MWLQHIPVQLWLILGVDWNPCRMWPAYEASLQWPSCRSCSATCPELLQINDDIFGHNHILGNRQRHFGDILWNFSNRISHKKQTDLVVSRTFALALLMCILHRVPREVGQLTKIPPIKSSCVQFCEKFHQVDTNNYHCVSKKFPPLKSV